MKSVRLSTRTKTLFLCVLTTLAIFVITSCARKIAFQTSPVVPAARGTVSVTKDNNNNYNIKIDIHNLSEPGRLLPAKQTYVVWLVNSMQETKNIGQIKTSQSLLSKTLKSSFQTVSAIKPVKIFITAEDDGSVQAPGYTTVLSTDNF